MGRTDGLVPERAFAMVKANLADAIAERDEARAERDRAFCAEMDADRRALAYRKALERVRDTPCLYCGHRTMIARVALNETQEQRFGARDDRPELCGGSRWLAGPEIDCPGCPDCQDGTQEQER